MREREIPLPCDAGWERDLHAKIDEYQKRMPETKSLEWIVQDLKQRYHDDPIFRLLYYKLRFLFAMKMELEMAQVAERPSGILRSQWVWGILHAEFDNTVYEDEFQEARAIAYHYATKGFNVPFPEEETVPVELTAASVES